MEEVARAEARGVRRAAMILAALAGLAALAALAEAGRGAAWGRTPEGWRVSLAGAIDPDPVRIAALRIVGRGEAFVYVADHRGEGAWFSFAMENPDTLRWPRGRSLQLVMRDGSIERARELYAITPEGRRLRLRDQGVAIEGDAIERRRFRGGNVASVLFGGFRFEVPADSVAEVRIGEEPRSTSPAAPGGGRSP